MKHLIVGMFVLSLATPADAAVLRCPGATVTVTPTRIKVTGWAYDSLGYVKRSHAGDCAGRPRCYQEGQWMANVSGRVVRINTDTDDNVGTGVRLGCVR